MECSCCSARRNHWAAGNQNLPAALLLTSHLLSENLILTIKITFAVLQALVLPPLPFPLVHMVSKERHPLQPWLFAHSYQGLGIFAAERKVRKHLQSQSSFVSYLSELSADRNSSPVKTGIPLTYMV